MSTPQDTPYPDDLSLEDVSVTRALGGTVNAVTLLRAHVHDTAAEHRPQQEEMTAAVEAALRDGHPLLAQAGTGTGKSLAYLFALASAGKRAVIATATNQLSEQLTRHDLPQVAASLAKVGRKTSYATLKGRGQYVCAAKIAELNALEAQATGGATLADEAEDIQDALFPGTAARGTKMRKTDAAALRKVMTWAKKTPTGDRSDAPAVADRVWAQVSTDAKSCPGATLCPFSDVCMSEKARATARAADIVVTNHAMLALDLAATARSITATAQVPSIFGARDVIIVDEAHDFPEALTNVFAAEVDPYVINRLLDQASKQLPATGGNDEHELIVTARAVLAVLATEIAALPAGPLDTLPTDMVGALDTTARALNLLANAMTAVGREYERTGKPKRYAAVMNLAKEADELAGTVVEARAMPAGQVRWVETPLDASRAPKLRIAPIEIGERLNEGLGERTLIGTSATLSLDGDFAPMLRAFGMPARPPKGWTIDVGSPFDYPKQGMLYIPSASFPAPVGRERIDHTAAVLDDLTALVTAAGGRTLALFTTTAGAHRAAEHLRTQLPGLTILAHGDAPADALVRQFTEDEESVLCATMGLWQGTSVPGPSCSLVVIDKVAFAPVDDVLTAARRAHVDAEGRDGFREVILAAAAISLAQGAGRLIRTQSDRGVVAILDPRLRTKGYGKTLLGSLPNFRTFSDRAAVEAALVRLTGGHTPSAAPSTPRTTATAAAAKPKRGAAPRASKTRSLANRRR